MDIIIGAEYSFCLACANVFENADTANVSCALCGYQISKPIYDIIYNYANGSVKYGYIYRKMYEKDVLIREHLGGPTRLYSLGPYDQYLVFAGMSALGGVIGNASYDSIKAMIRALRSRGSKTSEDDLGYVSQLRDNERIKIFLDCVRDYTKDFAGINPKVVSLIREEVLTHKAVELLHPKSGSLPKIKDRKSMLKIREKAAAELAKNKQKIPKRENLKDLGKNFRADI